MLRNLTKSWCIENGEIHAALPIFARRTAVLTD
jgi:hypothetical protein